MTNNKDKDWEQIGRRNKNRGQAFERLCAERPQKLGLTLLFKWIDRTHRRGVSLSDIECVDFSELKIDCKFTEGEFTTNEKRQLVAETRRRYGENSIVIIGEKKGRTKLNWENVMVLWADKEFSFVMVPYDEFLQRLDKLKGFIDGNATWIPTPN